MELREACLDSRNAAAIYQSTKMKRRSPCENRRPRVQAVPSKRIRLEHPSSIQERLRAAASVSGYSVKPRLGFSVQKRDSLLPLGPEDWFDLVHTQGSQILLVRRAYCVVDHGQCA